MGECIYLLISVFRIFPPTSGCFWHLCILCFTGVSRRRRNTTTPTKIYQKLKYYYCRIFFKDNCSRYILTTYKAKYHTYSQILRAKCTLSFEIINVEPSFRVNLHSEEGGKTNSCYRVSILSMVSKSYFKGVCFLTQIDLMHVKRATAILWVFPSPFHLIICFSAPSLPLCVSQSPAGYLDTGTLGGVRVPT